MIKPGSHQGLIILFRRDTLENWCEHNPVLIDGEPGICTDTKVMKVGDGIHCWTELPYSTLEDMIDYMTGAKK